MNTSLLGQLIVTRRALRVPQTLLVALTLFITTLAGTISAHAESLRCDKALLQRGTHMYEVSKLCGAPVAEFSRLEFLQPNVPVYVDEWIYRLGRNKFERLLRFENNRLRSVRTLRKPVSRTPDSSRDTLRNTGTVHRISW